MILCILFVSTIENCASPLFLQHIKRNDHQMTDTIESGIKRGNAHWFTEELQSPFIVIFLLILVYTSLKTRRAALCDCGTPWAFLLPFFA